MKSAYELAMERLTKGAPSKTLSAAKKAEIADLESLFKSRIAQLELSTQNDLASAQAAGDAEKLELIRGTFTRERAKLEAEREVKKGRVRDSR